MRIAVSGSTGLIGAAVVKFFEQRGDHITRMIRPDSQRAAPGPVARWDIQEEKIDLDVLEGHDYIIHLGGVNIADKRWTSKYKELIYSSRVEGTKFLSQAILNLRNPPKALFSASAIGYYGNHEAARVVDESTPNAHDFLANVCRAWEQATLPAERTAVRVVHMRMGAVLSADGGALAKMLPIFNKGLGGKIGNGQQMFSWIALDEIPNIILHLMNKPDILGAVNLTSPGAVTNAEFTETLGHVISKPTFSPLPGFMAKLIIGEMADALLLGGAKVVPRRLLESGYQFQYPQIEAALKNCLN